MAQRTIYIPDDLVEKYDVLENKSEFVRNALDNKHVTKKEMSDSLLNLVEKLHFYKGLDDSVKTNFINAATELIKQL